MRIRMKVSIAGAWVANAGDEVDRPDTEARRLIAAGFAKYVKQPAPTTPPVKTAIQRATLPQDNETATLPENKAK